MSQGKHRRCTCKTVKEEVPAEVPEQLEVPVDHEEVLPPPTPSDEARQQNEERLLQTSQQNLIAKLDNEKNLEELHLKHYHMSTAQFKKRTTHLTLPGRIYDLYNLVVKKCKFCNTTQARPVRSRVSGLRAEEFGDLIFLDHGSTKVQNKTYVFLVILDGATSYITVYPCISTSASEVIQKLHEWMDTYQCNTKSICGNMAFHSPVELKEFYRLHNIRALPTGPHTPWPNRAETGVRLFKKFFHTLVEDVAKKQSEGILNEISAFQLMRKAATIRNTQVTSSGKTPLELSFGRKPRDLLDPANMNPQQLTTAMNNQDINNETYY